MKFKLFGSKFEFTLFERTVIENGKVVEKTTGLRNLYKAKKGKK